MMLLSRQVQGVVVARPPAGGPGRPGGADGSDSDEDLDERFEKRVLKPLPVSGGVGHEAPTPGDFAFTMQDHFSLDTTPPTHILCAGQPTGGPEGARASHHAGHIHGQPERPLGGHIWPRPGVGECGNSSLLTL